MNNTENKSPTDSQSVTVIGNYLPRKCGIATFTSDLVESLTADDGIGRCRAVVMNDRPQGYDYPEVVDYEISQHKLPEYQKAAEFINMDQPDVVCLQHEFGIFGGEAGEYVLTLLQDIHAPVVTTLHTVLVEPSKQQKKVMEQLVELSDRLVVMSKSAVQILNSVYNIPEEKVEFIPHGIPDVSFTPSTDYKEKFGLQDKKVMLTFGLLSENKGIDYVIRGLPEVVRKFPDLTYVVLGATHPAVVEHEGERYRRKLQHLVEELGLEEHVIFENRFVSYEELCEYLAATDIYITPYNNEEQITSGTMAYACGTGKAVISTPYWYATEMLSEGRGRLVPFRDAGGMANAIRNLLENDEKRNQMRKRSYDYNRNAVWSEVAAQYDQVFREVQNDYRRAPHLMVPFKGDHWMDGENSLPPLKLDHLSALTDDAGILQHAQYTIPNRDHGYCTDDNARALLVVQQAHRLSSSTQQQKEQLENLSDRYLSFLAHAYNEETGRFRNFMNYSRQWLNPAGSEDAHGRALWALGVTAAVSNRRSDIRLASSLFRKGIQAAGDFTSPRAVAFTLIGLDGYLKAFAGDSTTRQIGSRLSMKLYNQFTANQREDWPWLEDILSYSNGKLPHALILAGQYTQQEDMTSMGLHALEWLMNQQTEEGYLSPIGNAGWFSRGAKKARFDQQPLEANGLMEACVAAYNVSGNERWLEKAVMSFRWFKGANDLGLPLYDPRNGGCCDGLESNKVNENQGAESTLAWLLSLVAMHHLAEEDLLQQSTVRLEHSYTQNGRG